MKLIYPTNWVSGTMAIQGEQALRNVPIITVDKYQFQRIFVDKIHAIDDRHPYQVFNSIIAKLRERS